MLGDNLLQLPGLALEVFDFAGCGRPSRVAGETPLAGFEELFRPAVVQALGDALPAAEFGNRGLAAQAVEDDADLLLGRILLRVARRMSRTSRSDGVSGVLDFCLMPTPQGVTMSPKSSVPQAASFVSQVLMSDSPQNRQQLPFTHRMLI